MCVGGGGRVASGQPMLKLSVPRLMGFWCGGALDARKAIQLWGGGGGRGEEKQKERDFFFLGGGGGKRDRLTETATKRQTDRQRQIDRERDRL